MPDYISREEAIKAIMGEPPSLHYPSWFAGAVKGVPSADVRENTHGRWIEDDYAYNHCSECGHDLEYAEYVTPYCPQCGASMEPDLETTEEKQSVLGRRITELLKMKGITQRELAEKVGVTEVAMSLYITGDKFPTNPVIDRMASFLDTTAGYLTGKPEKQYAQSEKITRAEILDTAKRIVTGDREDQYGKPEDGFEAIAALWADYLQGRGAQLDFLEAYDVAAMMALLKIARIATGGSKADNWIDLAGYAACGGELQMGGAHEQE